MSLPPNARLGRYEIRSSLGAGGMGEVYLAWDAELERTVALKLLPASAAADPQRMSRFIQEAKAASALNHPNILTIYDIGLVDNTRFIATEFIDGETLRRRAAGGMKLSEVLEVAEQVAFALTAAHGAKIIHRDIKPDNIMIRKDGIVKVLDFGLAKLTETPVSQVDSEAPTRAAVPQTDPGAVMGTVAYMSPEQARGLGTDERTDTWSLGVVLYEMIAGRAPFVGETTSHVVVSILEHDPPPLTKFAPHIPAELQRIVRKALTKERDERYQTARDLMTDLRNLRRELDISAEVGRSTSPPASESETIIIEAPDATHEGARTTHAGTPASATRTSKADEARSVPGAGLAGGANRRHRFVYAALISLALAAIAAFTYLYLIRKPPAPLNSIAILPFANDARDPGTDYLSDGISESLINSLSLMPNVKVLSRSAAFRYKGQEIDPQRVGRELGVSAILTGHVMQRGDNLSVSVELINAQDATHIWGEQYSRPLNELMTVQDTIVKQVADNLRWRMSGEDERRMTKRYTGNMEAYQLYLKGRYYAGQFTLDGFKRSVEAFNQAIALDPNYALAYAGLSDAYFNASTLHLPPAEALPKAKQAAIQAIERDNSLAEAHTSLANVKANYERDYAGAELEFKRAIELNPNFALAHFNYGWFLTWQGRFDEGIAEIERARQLDPLTGDYATFLGATFCMARRYDKALDQLQKARGADDKSWWTYYWLGVTYEQKRMYAEAIESYRTAAKLNDAPQITAGLAQTLALSGRRDEAQKLLDDLLDRMKKEHVPPYSLVTVYAGLGDKDQAFAWLDKSDEELDEWFLSIKVDPMLDPLRSDPRFADFIRRAGYRP